MPSRSSSPHLSLGRRQEKPPWIRPIASPMFLRNCCRPTGSRLPRMATSTGSLSPAPSITWESLSRFTFSTTSVIQWRTRRSLTTRSRTPPCSASSPRARLASSRRSLAACQTLWGESLSSTSRALSWPLSTSGTASSTRTSGWWRWGCATARATASTSPLTTPSPSSASPARTTTRRTLHCGGSPPFSAPCSAPASLGRRWRWWGARAPRTTPSAATSPSWASACSTPSSAAFSFTKSAAMATLTPHRARGRMRSGSTAR
mmetsp:Transcript_16320/g.32652  ORF Transcript_16320/g.32652 Transcript_16320/m.32652 type:complete len:261 (+) Transcript_16320:909-1691(+)